MTISAQTFLWLTLLSSGLLIAENSTAPQRPKNQRPVLASSQVTKKLVEARTPVKVTATFTDPDDDYIVDVIASWRMVGSKGWAQKRMLYIKGSSPSQFETEIHPTGQGDYEVEFRAADKADLSDTGIIGKSKWAGRKTFTSWIRARNHSPQFEGSNVQHLDENGTVRISALFHDADPGDLVVGVQARWRETGTKKWQVHPMNWVKITATPKDFVLVTKIPAKSFELQFRASDAPSKLVKGHTKTTTKWTPSHRPNQ